MSVEIIAKKRNGIINPIFNCQPCGAQFAVIGIKDCIGLVHGGQGCCTFVRLMFAQHFKENFDLASSSLHEDAAVFGAMDKAIEGCKVLAVRYPNLKVIPMITTCSTETIGDDMESVQVRVEEYLKKEFPDRDIKVFPIHTPSYAGSQVQGYDIAVLTLVKQLAVQGTPNGKLNVFTGWINPGDVNELKYILSEMGIDTNILLDTSNFDAPMLPDKSGFACGNTTVEDFVDSANGIGSIALYKYEGGSAAEYLDTKFKVPAVVGITPIGIANTDRFVQQIAKMAGKEIPDSLVIERGRALDAIVDLGHMFLADKKVAIYGDPDLVIGLAEFCIELGMKPILVLFGDDLGGYKKDERVLALQEKVNFDMEVVCNADLWELESRLKEKKIELDLILGHSKGRYVSIDYQIPMVRVGFPTFDRAGLWKYPVIGYKGAEWLAEQMANALFADMEFKKDKEWKLNVW
jgi:vanadium-dependent nitrogenase beta chain